MCEKLMILLFQWVYQSTLASRRCVYAETLHSHADPRERRWGRRSRIRRSFLRNARTNKLSRAFVALRARCNSGFRLMWKDDEKKPVCGRMNHRGSFDVTSIRANHYECTRSAFRNDICTLFRRTGVAYTIPTYIVLILWYTIAHLPS